MLTLAEVFGSGVGVGLAVALLALWLRDEPCDQCAAARRAIAASLRRLD
jgi:hypothetical protein